MPPLARPGGSGFALALVVLSLVALTVSRGNYDPTALLFYLGVLAGAWMALATRVSVVPDETRWRWALYGAYLVTVAGHLYRDALLYPLSPGFLQWMDRAVLLVLAWSLLIAPPIYRRLPRGVRAIVLSVAGVAMVAVYLLVPTDSLEPWIDVWYVQQRGAAALLDGENPYAIAYSNLYGSSAGYYPDGVARYYPYPPLSLAFPLLGNALGDVRWVFVLCQVATGLALLRIARTSGLEPEECFQLATLFFFVPVGPFVVEQAWTDVTVTFALAPVALAVATGTTRWVHWLAGLALALKQTMVLFALLWLIAGRGWSRRSLGALVSIPLVTAVPFLVWDPAAMWKTWCGFTLRRRFAPMASPSAPTSTASSMCTFPLG